MTNQLVVWLALTPLLTSCIASQSFLDGRWWTIAVGGKWFVGRRILTELTQSHRVQVFLRWQRQRLMKFMNVYNVAMPSQSVDINSISESVSSYSDFICHSGQMANVIYMSLVTESINHRSSMFVLQLNPIRNIVPWRSNAGSQLATTGLRVGFCWRLATNVTDIPP